MAAVVGIHIKTCLWGVSNTFIKFAKDWFIILSTGKHKQITKYTFFDDFLPLEHKMNLKGLGFQHQKMSILLFP